MDHWADFWKQDHLTTFGRYFSGNYQGEIADFWFKQFSLLNANSVIFDVGTGNGAVALMAEEYSNRSGLNLSISACDAAEISPPSNSEVSFYSGVTFEEIGLVENSIDFICSNYGLEYTDYLECVAKIYKVLNVNGMFCSLIHSDTSVVAGKTRSDIGVYNSLFSEFQIFPLLAEYFENIHDSALIASLKPHLNGEINRFLYEKSGELLAKEIVHSISKIISQSAGKKSDWAIAAICKLESDLRFAARRLTDMKNASLSEDAINGLKHRMRGIGFKNIRLEKLSSGDGELGWTLSAVK